MSYYGFKEDCKYWYQIVKQVCDLFGDDVYWRYKEWCDDYFYFKYWQEIWGIGGLFFDDLNEWFYEICFDFMCLVGDVFIQVYCLIVQKCKFLFYIG